MNALCKVFNFFLSIFDAVLTVIVQAANSLLNAALDVLESVASSVGSPLLTVLGLGLFAWWILSGSNESTTSREAT